MTKLLDRVLGLAATKAEASASCPPDPYTQKVIYCTGPGNSYVQTCRRTCQTKGNCSGETCSAWSCSCIAADAGHC